MLYMLLPAAQSALTGVSPETSSRRRWKQRLELLI